MFLANFAHNPKIKEFWRHKLSQKKTNLQETLLKINSPVLQVAAKKSSRYPEYC